MIRKFTEKISVVMPTYNTSIPILREAVESILIQTYSDFEFIIIDDCSTDGSWGYLCELNDQRIKLFRNETNLGITKSLIFGFNIAKGKYIARMDSDDIALPSRLEKQFKFMEKNPDVIVCGSYIQNFGADVRTVKTKGIFLDMEMYRISTLFRNPGPFHPTAFFNHELLLRYHLSYDDRLLYAQDYGLYAEIGQCGQVCNLKEILLKRRIHSDQITCRRREAQIKCDKMTQKKLLLELLDNVSEQELDLHYKCSTGQYGIKINSEMMKWYNNLIARNEEIGKYNKRKFRYYIFDTIIKNAIIRSFTPEIGYRQKVKMFYQYMPFLNALKASIGLVKRWLQNLVQV